MRKIKARKKERGKKLGTPSENCKVDPGTEKPIFSLVYLRKDYCLSSCNKDEKAAFTDTLYRLSQLTWNEITCSPRHGLGYEVIDRSAIRSGMPNHIQKDVKFIAFRFCGKASMVGYRDSVGYRDDNDIFHIIWVDRQFKLYKHS